MAYERLEFFPTPDANLKDATDALTAMQKQSQIQAYGPAKGLSVSMWPEDAGAVKGHYGEVKAQIIARLGAAGYTQDGKPLPPPPPPAVEPTVAPITVLATPNTDVEGIVAKATELIAEGLVAKIGDASAAMGADAIEVFPALGTDRAGLAKVFEELHYTVEERGL